MDTWIESAILCKIFTIGKQAFNPYEAVDGGSPNEVQLDPLVHVHVAAQHIPMDIEMAIDGDPRLQN